MRQLRVGIVGGGTGGSALLELLLAWPKARVAVVADLRPEAPAIKRARGLGIATAGHHREVFSFPLDLVLEVTGDRAVLDDLLRDKPPGVEIVGAAGLRFFWNLLQDLTQTRTELTQSQKMEVIGLLAAGVAHDFNNILAVLAGRTEILRHRLRSDAATMRDLDLSAATIARGGLLVQQLLALATKQKLQPEIVDVNAVVTSMGMMLERWVAPHVRIKLGLAPTLGCVRADTTQLGQVLLNLAVNARDAMPEGGWLTIETVDVDLMVVRPGAPGSVPPGRYVVIRVSDTGCGIPPEVLPRIFEPFFTTKERGQGTGLGLSTVYGIVTQSGGFLQVESQLGQGTVFAIFLPRIEADAGDQATGGG